MLDIKSPKRMEDEAYKDYRIRRKRENRLIENHLKGWLVWDSAYMGPFRRKKATE